MSHILISGSPMDGFTFTGPFPDLRSAEEHAATFAYTDWYVGVINPPEDEVPGDPDVYEVTYDATVTAYVVPLGVGYRVAEIAIDREELRPTDWTRTGVPENIAEVADVAVHEQADWIIR